MAADDNETPDAILKLLHRYAVMHPSVTARCAFQIAADEIERLRAAFLPPIHLPRQRPDGWPRRSDWSLLHPLERELYDIVLDIEGLGASVALTRCVAAISDAREHLADHLEGVQRD
jgi:hypothetical protein